MKSKTNLKLLITGSSGLIGTYLKEEMLASREAFNFIILKPTHKELDISNSKELKQYFKNNKPDLIIHCAAHRNATTAEDQRGDKSGSVWKTNVIGTKNIAEQAKLCNAYLIHISTDYVFAGRKENQGPFEESAPIERNDRFLSWYGITKREAELLVISILPSASIIRINNIANPKNQGELDYIGKILWLYKRKKLYPLFIDQQISLTYLPLLINIIRFLLNAKKSGIFHASSSNTCTPHELAEHLIEKKYNKKIKLVHASIDSFLIKHPHRYPKYGGLSSKISEQKLGVKILSWQEIIDTYLD